MRNYIITLLLTVVSTSVHGQTAVERDGSASESYKYEGIHMREFLKLMPDSIVPLLTHNNILDFIDFIESGQESAVTNRMHGKSRMTQLEDDYARIELTSHSIATFKLLPQGADDVLIYMITTTRTDSLYDSHVEVYRSDWSLAPSANQFEILHPDCFTELTVVPQKSTLHVLEVEPVTLFEGETESERPRKENRCMLLWNRSSGMFDRKDYESISKP